jgi:hypothetical protein
MKKKNNKNLTYCQTSKQKNYENSIIKLQSY